MLAMSPHRTRNSPLAPSYGQNSAFGVNFYVFLPCATIQVLETSKHKNRVDVGCSPQIVFIGFVYSANKLRCCISREKWLWRPRIFNFFDLWAVFGPFWAPKIILVPRLPTKAVIFLLRLNVGVPSKKLYGRKMLNENLTVQFTVQPAVGAELQPKRILEWAVG